MTSEPNTAIISKFGPQFQKKIIIILGTIIAAMAVYLILPPSIGELARRTVAILIIAAVFWATEVLPLFATSLCVIALEILFLANKGGLAAAGLAPNGGDLSYKAFLAPFASGIIILFMGGFLLSAAVTKHGLDKAIASKIIKPFAKSPLLLLYGVLGITAFFSMWMSNTATAAMMLAIIAPHHQQNPPRTILPPRYHPRRAFRSEYRWHRHTHRHTAQRGRYGIIN